VGTAAGADVFWSARDGVVSVLVGHDDETWDIAFVVPVAVVIQLADEARAFGS
jgi:hypothetical protein